MPQYRYDAPESSYGRTITEMLARKNDAAARAAETIAQIQANAGIQSADAWSGAIRTIGAMPGQIASQARGQQQDTLRQRTAETENAIRQQQLSQVQRQDAGQRTMASAMQSSLDPSTQPQGPDLSQPGGVIAQTPNFLKPDENGVSVWDVEGLSKYMASKGYGDLNPMFVKDVNSLNDVVRTEAAARQATIRHGADMIRNAHYNPEISAHVLSTFRANGFYPPEMLDRVESTIGTPAFEQIIDGLGSPRKIENAAPGSMARDAVTGQVIPGSQVPEKAVAPTLASLALAASGGDPSAAVTRLQAPAMAGRETAEAAQAETARHNAELEKISRMTAGRAEASAAETRRHDLAMEESARNRVAARPMLSGDANRIADLDTSLTQLSALRGNISKTGAISGIEAWMPNVITEATGGIGAEAKARNAQIALVRQIIGKALKGGVLRKEDEIKYKAILPTINDSPDVAAKKLDGLEVMLKEKRTNVLEALTDAGFNTAAMTTRGDAAAKPKRIIYDSNGHPVK